MAKLAPIEGFSKCRWGEAGGGFETGGEVLGIIETAGIGDLFDGEIRLL